MSVYDTIQQGSFITGSTHKMKRIDRLIDEGRLEHPGDNDADCLIAWVWHRMTVAQFVTFRVNILPQAGPLDTTII